jgi:DNA helicase-2/ATP-dependent DNA helicase PcrA
MIVNHTIQFPKDNILCITYTNRASDEIKNGLKTDKVYVGTIHSFLNSFISIYFSHRQIIDLYFEIYGDEIRKRIVNVNEDESYAKSNEKYAAKYGELSYEAVYKNIKLISYNESQFNSLYYGGLYKGPFLECHSIICTDSEDFYCVYLAQRLEKMSKCAQWLDSIIPGKYK